MPGHFQSHLSLLFHKSIQKNKLAALRAMFCVFPCSRVSSISVAALPNGGNRLWQKTEMGVGSCGANCLYLYVQAVEKCAQLPARKTFCAKSAI